MDEGTRYLLASYLTKERNAAAARAVMRKARDAADSPPETIKTDRLRSYQSAVKEVFPDAEHIQSEGIRSKDNNNNLSERVQGTFRQRTKTMRGLDSKESGQRYLDGWVLNYNLFRELMDPWTIRRLGKSPRSTLPTRNGRMLPEERPAQK